jgi:hypothetical protein
MNDLQERVARAIAYAAGDDYYEDNPYWLKLADAAIAAGVGAVQWRPMSEAPKDGTEILATNARLIGGFRVILAWDDEVDETATKSGHCWWGQEAAGRFGYHTDALTHWTIPPEGPSGDCSPEPDTAHGYVREIHTPPAPPKTGEA